MKVVKLHEWTLKQFLSLILITKIVQNRLSISRSDSGSNPICPCEAVLYPAILIVSAVLYSEIIDSITGL